MDETKICPKCETELEVSPMGFPNWCPECNEFESEIQAEMNRKPETVDALFADGLPTPELDVQNHQDQELRELKGFEAEIINFIVEELEEKPRTGEKPVNVLRRTYAEMKENWELSGKTLLNLRNSMVMHGEGLCHSDEDMKEVRARLKIAEDQAGTRAQEHWKWEECQGDDENVHVPVKYSRDVGAMCPVCTVMTAYDADTIPQRKIEELVRKYERMKDKRWEDGDGKLGDYVTLNSEVISDLLVLMPRKEEKKKGSG